jgi:hypothetical protein
MKYTIKYIGSSFAFSRCSYVIIKYNVINRMMINNPFYSIDKKLTNFWGMF